MSSTNRGGERAADDFYETPAWCVRAILFHLPALAGRRILEPSAGRGAIVRELLRAGATDVDAVEIDAARLGAVSVIGTVDERIRQQAADWRGEGPVRGGGIGVLLRGDFLRLSAEDFSAPFDLVVMNPPFAAAQEHVEHAISLLAPGGTVAALLRLAFCVSAKRAAFRAAHPFDLYPLASRPSFTPDGKTDSADYAWFLLHAPPFREARERGGRFAVLEGKGS